MTIPVHVFAVQVLAVLEGPRLRSWLLMAIPAVSLSYVCCPRQQAILIRPVLCSGITSGDSTEGDKTRLGPPGAEGCCRAQ